MCDTNIPTLPDYVLIQVATIRLREYQRDPTAWDARFYVFQRLLGRGSQEQAVCTNDLFMHLFKYLLHCVYNYIMHCIVLYCIVLYCIVLYYIVWVPLLSLEVTYILSYKIP